MKMKSKQKSKFKSMLAFFSMALFCLTGSACATSAVPPVCGGVTDNTSYDAPKEIASKTITSFSTQFFAFDKYDDDHGSTYYAEIKKNDAGQVIFRINGRYRHELLVDEQMLADVQMIIDKHGLVKRNGVNRVTAGLPYEHAPWSLYADYDSGERLFFRENGTPRAAWTSALRDCFVERLLAAGIEEARPPKDAMTILRFEFSFDHDGDAHSYYMIRSQVANCIYLQHYVYDPATKAEKTRGYAVVTDALLEGLQDVILAQDLDALHAPETVDSSRMANRDGYAKIHVDYCNGRQIYAHYEAPNIPQVWMDAKDAIMKYLDTYIEENRVEPVF